MKKINLIKSITFIFVLFSVISFAQNNSDLAIAEMTVPPIKNTSKITPVKTTNTNDVLVEINTYLNKNIKTPDHLMDFYNSDITVQAFFNINKNGEISNITISSKSDKLLGEIVVKELKELAKTTPIQEEGKVVNKYVGVPVVFKIN